MKKILIIAVSLVAALCACTKQELSPADKSSEKQIIKAHVSFAETKLAFVDTPGSGTTSTWQAGDSFQAIQDGSKVVTFTLTAGAGTNKAEFTAETTDATDATTWVGVLGNGAAHEAEIHCGYMNQTGTLEGLDDFFYVKASATGLEPSFNFSEGTKLSYVLRIKLPAGIKCIEYTPCAYNKITSSTEELIEYNAGDKNDYSAKNTSTITLSSASSLGDFVYISIPLVNCEINRESYNKGKQTGNLLSAIVLTFMNDDSDNATASNGIVLLGDRLNDADFTGKGGRIGTVDVSSMSLLSRPKPTDAIKVETTGVSQSFSTSKQAGDLVTYWAPYNVGATSAAEIGLYVGFGENKPITEYSLEKVPAANRWEFAGYTLRTKGTDGTNRPAVICHEHAKFVNNSDNTTFYTTASSCYDLARVRWGCVWRTPHILEYAALFTNNKYTPDFSSTGVTVANVFFPFTGWGKANSIVDTGWAVCWTCDKNQRSASNSGWNEAYAMQITTPASQGTSAIMDRYSHQRGLNVRPVLASSEID